MKKIFVLFSVLVLLSSCSIHQSIFKSKKNKKSIVILYENDVHCGIDGYTKLAGLRDAIAKSDTAYAVAVSCGDYLQGGSSGAISKGQYIVDIMRNVGYDAVTLGNHEFDYGTPRMKELMPQIKAPVVCANFYNIGDDHSYYPPYIIKKYGRKKVAFVGATTPETMFAESYSFYDSEGRLLYDMKLADFYKIVQKAVDDARAEGADYVVLLSHVGETNNDSGIDSHHMVSVTRGIDVVLDGHSHSTIPGEMVQNMDGKNVCVTQTGTQLAHIGKLVISRKGAFSTTLIPAGEIPYTNAQVTHTTDSVKALLEQVTTRQVAKCDYALEINDAQGVRIIRNAETNLADLVTDAFRHNMSADIGLCNGGGIRNTIKKGVITYGDVTNVLPFDNHMCKIEAKGSEIVAMLERCIALVPEEDGSFPQVSGMKYVIHSASHKVSDVMVLNADTGEYVPIDLDATYSIGTTDYYHGGGFYGILNDCKVLNMTTVLARDAFSDYLERTLQGNVGDAFRQSQGRVTIIND